MNQLFRVEKSDPPYMYHTRDISLRVYLCTAGGKCSGAFSWSVLPSGSAKWLSTICIGSWCNTLILGSPSLGWKHIKLQTSTDFFMWRQIMTTLVNLSWQQTCLSLHCTFNCVWNLKNTDHNTKSRIVYDTKFFISGEMVCVLWNRTWS